MIFSLAIYFSMWLLKVAMLLAIIIVWYGIIIIRYAKWLILNLQI